MFPFIRLFAPFRHYVIGFTFIALFAFQIAQVIQPDDATIQTNDPRLADVVAYEDLLNQKATQVLHRFGADEYTVDLCVVLDHTTVTTTTFDPGQDQSISTSEALKAVRCETVESASVDSSGGVWQEEVSTAPRIRNLRVCVTLEREDNINQDELFQSLSYALGIDLSRGDVLKLVVK